MRIKGFRRWLSIVLLFASIFSVVFYGKNTAEASSKSTYTVSVFDGSGSLKTTINAEAGKTVSIKVHRYYTPSVGSKREIKSATTTPKLSDASISRMGDYAYCRFTMPKSDVTIKFTYESSPVPVILDMDFSSDVDDVMALRMATQADAEGYIDLVGVCLSTTSSGKIVEAVEGVLDYDGLTDVMIGTSVGDIEGESPYYDTLSTFKQTDHVTMTATELYQTVLSNTNEKVNIITTGYLTNLQALLLNADTRTLFIDNVDTVYIQGGSEEGNGDNNLSQTQSALSATQSVVYECTLNNVNAVFIPADFANDYVCGSVVQKNLGVTDPVGAALVDWHNEWTSATPSYGRIGWDPTAVWLAVQMMCETDGKLYETYPLYINQNNDGSATFINTDENEEYTANALSVKRTESASLPYVASIDSILSRRLISADYLMNTYSEIEILSEYGLVSIPLETE